MTIRIASGPPTSYGNYLYRPRGTPTAWIATAVENHDGVLSVYRGYGNYLPVSSMLGQWSTRIPDPEEME